MCVFILKNRVVLFSYLNKIPLSFFINNNTFITP
ncbi:hypothetical protein BB2000_2639 [Proteus mirabilis BB2000]|nr:hypothetical protein BB2000_2639 [Proteus mirabilis BB2000]